MVPVNNQEITMPNSNNSSNNNISHASGSNMSIKEILIAIHNQAIDDLATIHNNDVSISYMEAVMDCYEEVLRQLNVEETDEILEEILNMNLNSMTSDNTQENQTMKYENQLEKTLYVNGLVGVAGINLGIRMLCSPSMLKSIALVDTNTRLAILAPLVATSLPMVLVILWLAHSLFPQSMNGKWGSTNRQTDGSTASDNKKNTSNNTNVNKAEISMNNKSVKKQLAASVSDEEGASPARRVAAIPVMDGEEEVMKEKLTFNFKSYGNQNAVVKLTVEYDIHKKLIKWNGSAYKINERLISVKKNFSFEDKKYDFEVVEVKEVITLIANTLKSKTQLKEALDCLQGLVGTVLISEWEVEQDNPNNYNLSAIHKDVANLRDAQAVLRENEVAAFHVNNKGQIILKKERGEKTAWVEGCLETATSEWGFALPDKTNTKRAFVGDAIGIMGVSADGKISMVSADKGGKFFNRHAMVKHISAEVENPTYDGLVAELSNNKYAAHYGAFANSLYVNHPLLSLAVGDGGFVVRNPLTYIVNKRIDGSLNIDCLFSSNPSYAEYVESKVGTNRKEQVEFLLTEVEEELLNKLEGKELSPNTSIVFKGVEIARTGNLQVSLDKLKVRKGSPLNTEIRKINVSLATKATISDYNHKARGQWFKGMATRNDSVVINGATEEVDVIFNDNSVKNRQAMLIRMWANANEELVAFCKDGKFRRLVEQQNGNFGSNPQDVDGIDFDKLEKDLRNSEFYKQVEVSINSTTTEVEAFKEGNPEAFANVKEQSLENGLVRLTFTAEGVQAPLVFAVELSSVAENFSPNRKTQPIQSALLATFDTARATATKTIKKHAKKVATTIEIAGSDKVDAHFDLRFAKTSIQCCQRNSLASILVDANKTHNPRDMFQSLSKKYKSFKVSGSTAEGTRHWNITIPIHILSVQGAFDKTGWSFDERVMDTYAFLLLLADKTADPELIADYAMSLGKALEGWRKDVVHNNKAFTKGSAVFKTHGMKVLANSTVGYEEHNGELIPVIAVDESNPLIKGTAVDKHGKEVNIVKDGDVVFFYRNPVVDLTPAIIRVHKDKTVCGTHTCAVSASVLAWSSQTDNDGDTLWIIPAKQVGISNVDEEGYTTKEGVVVNPSAVVASLMNHPLVGKKLADETMKEFKCDNVIAGIIKARSPFSLANPTVNVPSFVVDEAEKVAHHYRVRVGQGYSAMFNAFGSFINKVNSNRTFTKEELIAVKACSFVIYEEWGLAGYTAENEANFKSIYTLAKSKIGLGKAPVSAKAKGRFSKASSAPSAKDIVAEYIGQSIIQSKAEQGETLIARTTAISAIKEEALMNGLFRTLTKGAYSFGSSKISPIMQKATIDTNNPFSEALVAWQSFAVGGLVIA